MDISNNYRSMPKILNRVGFTFKKIIIMSNVRQLEGMVAQAQKRLEAAKYNKANAKKTNNWATACKSAKTYVSALGKSLNRYDYEIYQAQVNLKKRKAELAAEKRKEREEQKRKREKEKADKKKEKDERSSSRSSSASLSTPCTCASARLSLTQPWAVRTSSSVSKTTRPCSTMKFSGSL